jgi:FAD/FMN-containing dehydrogenase
LSTLSKDNTGYDVKQLFIGSEGTLGVITDVSIKTPKLPSAANVAVFGVESYEAVQTAFGYAKNELAEILSAFEFWDQSAFQLVMAHCGHLTRNPFTNPYPFYVLVETQGSNQEHDDQKLSALMEHLMEYDVIQDGVLAQDESQSKQFWNLRETIAESCGKAGAVYKYDLSMPVTKLYAMVEDIKVRLQDQGLYAPNRPELPVSDVVGYGHMGDGNLHLNITAKAYTPDITDAIEPYVYEWTQQHQGSISAEHGLGQMKAPYLHYSKSPDMIRTMTSLKRLFDPNYILNPYKCIV